MIWLAALAGWFGLGRLAPLERERWEWVLTVLAVVLFLVVPVAGLVLAMDLKVYLEWKGKRDGGSLVSRGLITLGCWLTGMVAGLMSVLSAVAAFHAAWSWSKIPMLLFALALMALGMYLMALPFRKLGLRTQAQEEGEWQAWQQELLAPEFDALEQEAGMGLLGLYKDLFDPKSDWLERSWEVLPEGPNGEVAHGVSRLLPARVSSLRRHPSLSGCFLAFAEGMAEGDEYWLEMDGSAYAVHLRTASDGAFEEVTKICPSLAVFLAWPRMEI